LAGTGARSVGTGHGESCAADGGRRTREDARAAERKSGRQGAARKGIRKGSGSAQGEQSLAIAGLVDRPCRQKPAYLKYRAVPECPAIVRCPENVAILVRKQISHGVVANIVVEIGERGDSAATLEYFKNRAVTERPARFRGAKKVAAAVCDQT